MENGMRAEADPPGSVRVEVSTEKSRLKKEHAGRPNARRTAEVGQDDPSAHRLQDEQRRRTDPQRQDEQRFDPGSFCHAVRLGPITCLALLPLRVLSALWSGGP